jgi:hypothetical protein
MDEPQNRIVDELIAALRELKEAAAEIARLTHLGGQPTLVFAYARQETAIARVRDLSRRLGS